MPTGPTLVSCTANSAEMLVVPVTGTGEAHIFVIKNHRGNPWREMETFTVADAATASGPFFFNINPERVEILDQTFSLITAYNPSGNIVRFFWNPGTSNVIRRMDYDVVLKTFTEPVAINFLGRDPFVIDARTGEEPERIYLTYIAPSGANEGRQSRDLGVSFGGPRQVSPTGDQIVEQEAVLQDPLLDKVDVCVTQRRL